MKKLKLGGLYYHKNNSHILFLYPGDYISAYGEVPIFVRFNLRNKGINIITENPGWVNKAIEDDKIVEVSTLEIPEEFHRFAFRKLFRKRKW